MKNIGRIAAVAAVAFGAYTAQAQDYTPAVVFDMGGKFDKSFNQGVFNGVEKFKSETGVDYREFEVTNETQREQAIRRMAQRGANPVLGVGFAQADAIGKVAPGISGCPLLHHRRRRRCAERSVHRVQGA